ncbi:MAG TPA: capsule assembly Wzi family protein [Ignavibacteria bacterium]
MNFSKSAFLFLILFAFLKTADAQLELVPVSHPVYDFLKRMQLKGMVENYNSANIPVSRKEVADYLVNLSSHPVKLAAIDKQFLSDYKVEFEYEMTGESKNQESLFSDFSTGKIFKDNKQKYIYNYLDSNATFFLDVLGNISHRESNGDSIKVNSITLGEIGFRLRGTLFNSLGYYLRASNGQKLKGEVKDVLFAANTDPKLHSNTKFVNENKNFDTFEGYIRYQTKTNWLALTIGREALNNGYGYIDKMFLSNNAVPFDFIKFDLNYKALKYSFVYGAIKGDSMGIDMKWKNIATHRLDVNLSRYFKFGLTETVISSGSPFNLTYLNPLNFLISADLNTGAANTTQSNSLLGIDFEVNPFNNFAFQGTLLIDDINLSTISDTGYLSNENKFGYQIGAIWTEAFTIPNITLALEYTRLNPFVYSHRSNKDQYTHWGLSLGHALPPNSDEIAAKLKIDVTSRIKLDLLFQYQRSGDGFEYDQYGNIITNWGGNINVGSLDFNHQNLFLEGHRINRSILTANFQIQPIRQYYLMIKYQYKISDSKYLKQTFKDSFFFVTAAVDF